MLDALTSLFYNLSSIFGIAQPFLGVLKENLGSVVILLIYWHTTAVFAHLLHNGLALFLSGAAKTYSALGLWPYILLIAVFCFCMFLALAMRTLESQMEKGRIRRLQYQNPGATLTGILVSPGIWLLVILFALRVLY